MTPCECRGLTTRGVPCGAPSQETTVAAWVGHCEHVLCSLCASFATCCACGAPAAGHYRPLVAEAIAS